MFKNIKTMGDFVLPFINKNGFVNAKGHEKAKEIARKCDSQTLANIIAFFDSVGIYVSLDALERKSKKKNDKFGTKDEMRPLFGELD